MALSVKKHGVINIEKALNIINLDVRRNEKMKVRRNIRIIGIGLVLSQIFLYSARAMHFKNDDIEMKKYVWKQVVLEYSPDWKIDADADHNQTRNVRLIPKTTKYLLLVVLTINPNAPESDKVYSESPALGAVSFGYSIAKQAAKRSDGNGGFVSYDEVQLGDGPAAASQIVLPTTDGKKFASVHSFVTMRHGVMLVGAVVIVGESGRIVEDPTFHKDLAIAYAILRSIRINKPQS
jgi:hypothetical protein